MRRTVAQFLISSITKIKHWKSMLLFTINVNTAQLNSKCVLNMERLSSKASLGGRETFFLFDGYIFMKLNFEGLEMQK